MRAFALCLPLTLLLVTPVGAQSLAATYAGRPVESIQLVSENKPTTEASLLDLIETKIGQPLSIAAVRETIAHLYGLGRFQDVQVDATASPAGGVVLTYNLVPLHSIREIDFKGTLGVSSGRLRSTVVERYGNSPSIGRLDAVERTLEQFYADNGYMRAQVDASPRVLHDPDRTILTFSIDAGPRATIHQVNVVGEPRTSRDAFLAAIGARPGQPYLRPRLQQRLDKYVRRLRQRHFYEASASLVPTESEDGRSVDLAVTITPGPTVIVRFEGDPIPAARLNELAPLEREGSVNEDLIEDSETRIENYLRQQGYWKAEVTPERQTTGETLTITFKVNRGRQYRMAGETELAGVQSLALPELLALVPLKVGGLFLESELNNGVGAIRSLYHQRGFASVDVKSGVNELDPPRAGEGLVRPSIVIQEGSRSLFGDVIISGNSAVATTELRPLVQINSGDAYYEPRVIEARDALMLEYLNRGFASVAVRASPTASDDHTRVTLVFTVQEGPQTIVDHVMIVGNVHTDADVILRELRIKPGQPFGLQDQFESRRRLSALGLFRRVRITEVTHGSGNEHDVLVTVEEAPATTIGYGGGLEASQILRSSSTEGGIAEDRLEFAPRGFFDIGRRNLFGANRSVNLYTRVSLRPKNPSPDDVDADTSGFGFAEYRVVGTYRQPRWFGANDLTLTGVVEQGVRSTFNFARRGTNVDMVRRLSPAMRMSGRYSLSSTRTFDEKLSPEDQATIDRLFPHVRLSGFSGALAHDTRDDLVDPTRGSFLSGEGTIAARALGGEVGFMKTYLQGFTFHRLPGPRNIIFATRAALGLADGFEREKQTIDDEGNPQVAIVDDLPASERFFAGGDTTIRGFALDSVGAAGTISSNGFPIGGNAVLLLNGELRVPVWRDFGAVVFVDGGNVFRRVTEIDLGELRGSAGFGVRYRSPFGSIRLDLGFKMDKRPGEGSTAIHFSLGQAF